MDKSGLRFVAHLIDRTTKKPSRKNQLKDAELQFRPVHSEGSRQVINPSRRSLSANSDTRCAELEPGSIQDSFGVNDRFCFANCTSFFFRSSYVIGVASSQVDCVTFFSFAGHTKKILFRNSAVSQREHPRNELGLRDETVSKIAPSAQPQGSDFGEGRRLSDVTIQGRVRRLPASFEVTFGCRNRRNRRSIIYQKAVACYARASWRHR